MLRARTYLDHNATAPLRPEARAAMIAALDVTGNASSVHAEGRRANAIIETARERVAALVGAKPAEVVFTSGASEANAMVLAGKDWGGFVCSSIEHPSILAAAPKSVRTSLLIAAGPDGRATIDDDLVPMLNRVLDPLLVSQQLVNGETGAIHDVVRLAALVRTHRPDAFVHTDAVQAAGRIAIDFENLGVDALTLSSHKLGGPQGAGALVVAEGRELAALIRGGGQEQCRRAGTENVAAIAGFGAAADAGRRGLGQNMARIERLRASLEAGIRETSPAAVIVGQDAPRIANTSCIAVPGAQAETLVMQFDLAGIAISAGAACSSGKVGPNTTLLAMGLPPEIARAAIRVSLGNDTTDDDIAAFLTVWRGIAACQRRAA